ncbi:hypothetical protein EHW66_20565 [Erwinia psidii]|uniref:hypothetical protein n=1 Tax=Erwinia psidii TaxID=69224 RepID=UPI00226B9D98|nr:hypothetical protein [Erwinia psidii]MCX8959085.1 hypothetical protein [Erwinia psidii]MCX8967275.1 hypothetical protein [Erwinia psidii]
MREQQQMASDMSEARDKIISNGFSTRELLSVRWIFRELKQVYHPKLTQDLSLEAVITEEARKSLSFQKYYLVAVLFSVLIALLSGRPDYLYMPAAFLLFMLYEIYASARIGKRTIACEIKLMKLAIWMRL